MDASENSGFSPQIIHFNRVFHYKPSIWGVPLLLETPKSKRHDITMSYETFLSRPLFFQKDALFLKESSFDIESLQVFIANHHNDKEQQF